MVRDIDQSTKAKEFDALLDTLYVIGGKWKIPIIHAICSANRQRFREIERSVTGITSRMLARELKEMEMNRLITRTVYAETPVRIEYEVTDYCKTLVPMIQSMIDWGMLHRQKIKES
ncbi:winged helix-turn-helix transcriptional regulator [Spirosoma endophyticum]|uniref:Transcriptional regulator, HxlR family n=1 Tax=Spirosoma endophyticum TaxID=662367 RepID=A0A1I2H1M2_9BACT|nr:helix-turn-helix domain-containing protein [Spirosoma endophyticum]SFF23293.1 transcriptional regulator, HxlR family [Spirosoma endophyticum]